MHTLKACTIFYGAVLLVFALSPCLSAGLTETSSCVNVAVQPHNLLSPVTSEGCAALPV